MFGFRKKKPEIQTETDSEELPTTRVYSDSLVKKDRREVIRSVLESAFTIKPQKSELAATVDFFDQNVGTGNAFGNSLAQVHLDYFASRSFIGFQACAIFAQHWLIDNACTIPVDDALRKGYELTKNDEKEFDASTLSDIKELDKQFDIINKVRDFGKFGRVYGIRIAVFNIDSSDPKYYELPFNIDGVKDKAYKGISFFDPYYITPYLTADNTRPGSQSFYEPDYWLINGKKYHKSHLVIFRHSDVAQVLKPSYIYGGISLTQQIFEAVYNAEITASEVPMIVQTMRMNTLKTDIKRAIADPVGFEERVGMIHHYQNNYGTRFIGLDDDFSQIQTTLTGLDELVMGRYQIVAAVAKMPIAKLMMTDLTGGLVKGGGEEAIYHESLESLQMKLKPMLERHYQLLLKSEFGNADCIDVEFNKLDAMTEKEMAEVNLIKSQTARNYQDAGSIDGQDIRDTLISDPQSGFNGLTPLAEFGEDLSEDI